MNETMVVGDRTFTGESEFSGMIGGNAIVADGATLLLSGMVKGDLIIQENAQVVLTGMVGGHIINNGGTFENRGMTRR